MSAQASVHPPVLIGSPPSQLTPLAPVCSQLTPLTPACSQLSPASQLTPSTGRPKWISRFTFWCPHYMSAQASVHPPLLIGSPPSQLTPLAPVCSQLTPLTPACSQLSPASQLTPSTGRPKWISRFTFWCPHYMSAQASVHPPLLIGSPPSQLTPLAPVCSQLTPLTPACSQLSPASQLTPSTGRPKWISRFTFWCPHYMSAQASVHPPLLIGSPLSQLTPLAPACSQLSPACSSLPAHSPHSSLLQLSPAS